MKFRKEFIGILLGMIIILSSCYEFESIQQPATADPNSNFNVNVSIIFPSLGDSTYQESFYSVLLPSEWTSEDSFLFSGTLNGVYHFSQELSDIMESQDPAPAGYNWWTYLACDTVDTTAIEGGTLSFTQSIHSGATAGVYSIDYRLGFPNDPIYNYSEDNDYRIWVGIDTSPIAANLYVNPSGNDENSGLSSTDPLKTIATALLRIDADSLNKRRIILADGEYKNSNNGELFPIYLPEHVSLLGDSKMGVILDAEEQHIVIVLDSVQADTISDLTITGGVCCEYWDWDEGYWEPIYNEYGGGGIYATNSHLNLENAIIKHNSNDDGGGIEAQNANLTLNCVAIINNIAINTGGGISVNYPGESNSEMFGQIALTNSIITENTANAGSAISAYHTDVNFQFSTITANTALQNDGYANSAVSLYRGINPVFENCILWNNSQQEISYDFYPDSSESSAISLSYCDVQGGESGINVYGNNVQLEWSLTNIDANPLFLNPLESDYHLSDFSPCISVGLATDGIEADYDGLPRPSPVGSDPDIGAYESVLGSPDLGPDILFSTDTINFHEIFLGYSDTLTLILANRGSETLFIDSVRVDQLVYGVEWDSGTIGSGSDTSMSVSFTPTLEQNYPAIMTIFSNDPDNAAVNVTLSGSGAPPPSITVSPSSIEIDLVDLDTISVMLEIANDGGADLEFDLTREYLAPTGNHSLTFDGETDYVDLGNDPSLNPTDAITVSAWIMPYSHVADGYDIIVDKPWSSSVAPWSVYSLKLSNDEYPRAGFQVSTNSVYHVARSQEPVPMYQWTHVAGTYDGEKICFYENGELKRLNDNASGPIDMGSMNVYMGYRYYNSNSLFHGKIAEVRIWNIARTQTEIQSDMFTQLSGTETGLVGYWPFDEGSGMIVNDHSENENTGYLHQVTQWQISTFEPSHWIHIPVQSGVVPATSTSYLEIIFGGVGNQSFNHQANIRIQSNDPILSLVQIPVTLNYTYLPITHYKALPTAYEIDQNSPNPFNPTTTIRYDLPEESNVKLTVFDIRGQQVLTLQDNVKPPGNYEVKWNGMDQSGKQVSTGVYFCRLQAGTFSQTIKMVYLR